MRIGFAQVNTTVGDFQGNRDRILAAYAELVDAGAELVLTPELAVTGYPPMDLLFQGGFLAAAETCVNELHEAASRAPLLVGFVERNTNGAGAPFRNAAAVLERGRPRRIVHKTLLPTYDVFDEARYFAPAGDIAPLSIAGKQIGVTICEDVWTEKYLGHKFYGRDPVAELVQAGAECIVNLSASPYSLGKSPLRREMLSDLARGHGVPFAYCNSVGGNDQLIFDGASLAARPNGDTMVLDAFRERVAVVDFNGQWPAPQPASPEPAELHDALVLGLRDYFRKCGFQTALVGLSGGIDSAVTAVLAVEALGASQVTGVAMPSRYSSAGSVADARALADNLGIAFLTIPIEDAFTVMLQGLAPAFGSRGEDVTEENLQSRLRGVTMMALSNKTGALLLTTGNKSELAVGYCTLYGDMCGGLAVISDLPKLRVYELARWINREREIIPVSTIEKAPSAELRPDQRDDDSLPPYEILDAILKRLVEEGRSVSEIAAEGYKEETVRWVARQVDRNEYKRQQAAPGLRVTTKAFGLGRRVPIAQRFSA